ncbi:MAG TPA: A/G-specific adenine glycosylase [Actinomycetota bacterium]|nr:A/G-specific adenine glycosylase [Actinomycetota bacterium]
MASGARRPSPAEIAALRDWYRPRHRAYPWRRARPDPYAVLVSEVMLQQTQAVRVVPAFERFLRRFPDVHRLAGAGRPEVIRAWAGLGYNRRAVALHEAARAIERNHAGRVPRTPAELRRLPGVGPYTANAVASIAYGVPVPAPDVNVRRIVARVVRGRDPHDVRPADLTAALEGFLDRADPAAWNQALMDLGREVCRPSPRCDACPLRPACRFRAARRTPTRRPRAQGRFEGSMRQVRGGVVAALRERGTAGLAALARRTGEDRDRVRRALDGLERDGIVEAVGRSYRLHH